MPSNPEAVLVAAPATLHRQGLVSTLRTACPGLTICLVPDAELLMMLLHQRAYALLVLDAITATEPLGYLLEQLFTVRPRQPILCFTDPDDATRLPQLLPAGLCTLLPRSAAPGEVGRMVQLLIKAPAASWRTAGVRRSPPTPFSRRELDVLRLVVSDYCNREIAEQLCLSVRTVESHRRALLQKAGTRTLVGLAVQAVREGWVAD